MRTVTNQRIYNSALIPQHSVLVIALCAILFALCVSGQAQQPAKISRIGYLSRSSGPGANEEKFQQSLRSLGYIEGQTVVLESRFAHEKLDRLPELAADLVRVKVAIIVAGSGAATVQSAMRATKVVPIVMANVNDPIALGFVSSLAHPGGNVTGLSNLSPELGGKQLEVLKEIVPKLSRVAVLGRITVNLKELELASQSLGLQLDVLEVHGPDEIQRAFESAKRNRVEALLIPASSLLVGFRRRVNDLAAQHKLPAICFAPSWAEDGCLLAYGPDIGDNFRRAATYVDKILKGANPADLPVEQPRKFELVINLKTAKQIGLTIPPNVLARADKIIR
ncbi:MAG TPA: ABC transporter substrate-binding protein [Pyrinomonadaceae bacterium]|nr:ABC transporter substrate-binding protein [Pyrinomonadaceae bacterium]